MMNLDSDWFTAGAVDTWRRNVAKVARQRQLCVAERQRLAEQLVGTVGRQHHVHVSRLDADRRFTGHEARQQQRRQAVHDFRQYLGYCSRRLSLISTTQLADRQTFQCTHY